MSFVVAWNCLDKVVALFINICYERTCKTGLNRAALEYKRTDLEYLIHTDTR